MGGGWSVSLRAAARLYVYTPDSDTWESIDTPVYRYGLAIYRAQVVLVGGKEYIGEVEEGNRSKKVWTLSEQQEWQSILPSMDKACSSVNAVGHFDNLVVINGRRNKVHVYNGHVWAKAQHPPTTLTQVMSTVQNGHWYLIGAQNEVYCVSLDALVASEHDISDSTVSVWKRLPDSPSGYCHPAIFGNRLTAVRSSIVYAYSPSTQSWVLVGGIPVASHVLCATVLPSRELLVLMGKRIFSVALKCKTLVYNSC